MISMNYNSVFRDIGRSEERKALNMVPMEMRHKDVKDTALIATSVLQIGIGEIADA